MRNERAFSLFKVFFISSFFVFGLFYESIACIFCGIFGFFFLFQLMVNEHVKLYGNIKSFSIVIIIFSYLFSVWYGVDLGMGWIGFLKILTVFFFGCCMMQLSENQRDKMLAAIPAAGCMMTVFGLVSYRIKPAYEFFFTAERLGGFFQYANVFALLCLIGLILLAETISKNTSTFLLYVQAALLMAGIFLSGSRTVFFLAAFSGILAVIHKKRICLPFLSMAFAMFVMAFIYVGVTGNLQNVGRFLTASVHSSTFLGRLLYVKDGIRLCTEHPFGLGYLGYYFLEPSVQTGVYSVRYIHNDYLQMVLDIGVIPALFFICAIAGTVFAKRNSSGNICTSYCKNWEGQTDKRLVAAVIGLHCLVDFDLEFTSIWFVLLLTMNLCQGKEIRIATGSRGVFCKMATGIFAAAGIYTGIALLFGNLGNAELSAQLMPLNTEVKRELLIHETDGERAKNLAETILKQNIYIPEAYDVLAVAAYQKGDFQKMSEYKMQSLKLQKYNREAYERYFVLLSLGIEGAEREKDRETVVKLRKDVLDADCLRQLTKENTDTLAYQIRDVPDLVFSDEIENYIVQVKQFLDK